MESKTEQVIRLWKDEKIREAIAILHTFRLGFTKEEREKMKICHEMFAGSKTFYEKLGYCFETILSEVVEIVERYYAKDLQKISV